MGMTSPARPRVDAITFDYWNTLVYEDRGQLRTRRIEAWLGILEGEGFAVERQRIEAAFEGSWQRFLQSWQSGDRQYTHVDAAVDALDDLGYEVPSDVRDQLVDAFARTGDRAELHLTEGLEGCLRTLKGAGLRIGIVCDVGMTPSPTLRAFLAEAGVLGLFDHWSFSDEVGVYKPSPRIFEHALDGLGGIAPERAAHIGDLRRTDVAGAL
ncbi:MAG TPA: HAD family hydrolase, partial [Acidimicrobiales bacterium]|nr:HAD family hydrolase [Acidimicrobiales bacterium]